MQLLLQRLAQGINLLPPGAGHHYRVHFPFPDGPQGLFGFLQPDPQFLQLR